MTENGATDPAETKPRRITQGEIILALLNRGQAGGSSVTLARNAKGETQFEVVVRTDPDHGVETTGEASTIAQTVYDALAAKYPVGGAS